MTEEGINDKDELVTDEWPRADPDEGFGVVDEMNRQMNRKKRSPGHHPNSKTTGYFGPDSTAEYHGSGDHTEVAMAEGFFYVPKPTRKERDLTISKQNAKANSLERWVMQTSKIWIRSAGAMSVSQRIRMSPSNRST